MANDAEYNEMKEKITAHLKGLEGKGVDTIGNIAKNTGIKRRDVSKVLQRMEIEGLIQASGVMAGVAGYKLKG